MSVREIISVPFDQMLIDIDPESVEIIDDIEFEFSLADIENDCDN